MDFKVWCPERGETEQRAELFMGYCCPSDAVRAWANDSDMRLDEQIAQGTEEPEVHVRDEYGVHTVWAVRGRMERAYDVCGVRYDKEVDG